MTKIFNTIGGFGFALVLTVASCGTATIDSGSGTSEDLEKPTTTEQPTTTEHRLTAVSDENAQHLLDLKAARALWAEAGLTDYELTYELICFCDELIRQITVTDGRVSEVTELGSDAAVSRGLEPLSVERLFNDIEQSLLEDPFSAQFSYDAAMGYPTNYFIDFSQQIADEEFGIKVRSLVPIERSPTTSTRAAE